MGNFSIANAVEEYDFALKLFSPFISISFASKENEFAISELLIQKKYYFKNVKFKIY